MKLTPAQIRQKIADKIVERSKLDDVTVDDKGVVRSFTEDEQKRYDVLTTEITVLKDTLKRADLEIVDQLIAEPVVESRGVRSGGPGEAPAAHTKTRRHSFMRCLRIAAREEPMNGIEKEVHDELQRKAALLGRSYRGIAIPTGNDPETRRMMGKPALETRDLTTITGASTIYLKDVGFIDLLRANLVIQSLGATFLSDLKGIFAMTRQTSANVLQWVGEGISATPTNLTFDRVNFSPKFAVATSIITRELMMQTSEDVERLTEEDFAKDIALGIDAASINGPGGAQPLGLLNDPTVPLIPIGANGGPFTYGTSISMETQVAQANALSGTLAYLTNPRMRGSLKQQYVGTAGYPVFVYGKGSAADVGEINGYPVRVTTQVPANLTKGTATNACSAVIYGNWRDMIVGQWDTGLDMIVDPFTGKRSGAIEFTMYLALDTNRRHPESFVTCQDAIPAY